MDHGIGGGCALLQTFMIIEIAAMYNGTFIKQALCCLVAACETQHLVAGPHQFFYNSGAYKPGSSCNKYTHK